jgi:retinol dehydrogenase 12
MHQPAEFELTPGQVTVAKGILLSRHVKCSFGPANDHSNLRVILLRILPNSSLLCTISVFSLSTNPNSRRNMGHILGFVLHQIGFAPKPLSPTIRLDGQTALVTGSNVGLGLEAAQELAAHGVAHLILGVRSLRKGQQAKARISEASPQCKIEVWELDHSDFASVARFGERLRLSLDRLDIAILNAGVKMLQFERSATGHESNLQINHLATALLSLLVLEPLRRTAQQTNRPSRLTLTTSEGHFWVPFDENGAENMLTRMNEEDSFGAGKQRYYTTKLLNVLWVRELARRVDGAGVVVYTVNPGFCASQLHRHEAPMGVVGNAIVRLLIWTAAQGGHCLTDAAVLHPDSHGKYLSEQMVKE